MFPINTFEENGQQITCNDQHHQQSLRNKMSVLEQLEPGHPGNSERTKVNQHTYDEAVKSFGDTYEAVLDEKTLVQDFENKILSHAATMTDNDSLIFGAMELCQGTEFNGKILMAEFGKNTGEYSQSPMVDELGNAHFSD